VRSSAESYLDASSEAFVADTLSVIDASVPVRGAFLLGSGAVGGFDASTSDIDLVVVIERPLGPDRPAVVAQLAALETPARDLELVLYVEGKQPPAFELNLNEGRERPDEEPFWFILDAALGQDHAVSMWGRRQWSQFFDPIPPERTREAVQLSLEWAQRQGPADEFSRLHAARASHFLATGRWISKNEAS
jgi:predicted nucleotidyltransferase